MKLTCFRKDLHSAATSTARIVSSKPALPVLSHLLLTASPSGLIIQSTNLELSLSVMVTAKVEEEGKIAVPVRQFLDFVSSLTVEKLNVELAETTLKISGENFEAKIPTLAASDFPSFPAFPLEALGAFKKENLRISIQKTVFAAGTDSSRPALTGVLLKTENNRLFVVATDGFRLSEYVTALPENGKENLGQLIIPARTFLEVGHLLSEVAGAEEVSFGMTEDKNQIGFKLGNTLLFSRLLEVEYPDYRKIIPLEFNREVLVEKEQLTRAVKSIAIFSPREGLLIRLQVSEEGSLKILAKSAEAGEGKLKLAAETQGGLFVIGLNSRFLLDALNSFSGNRIKILIKEEIAPIALLSPDESDYKHIIMPVRIEKET